MRYHADQPYYIRSYYLGLLFAFEPAHLVVHATLHTGCLRTAPVDTACCCVTVRIVPSYLPPLTCLGLRCVLHVDCVARTRLRLPTLPDCAWPRYALPVLAAVGGLRYLVARRCLTPGAWFLPD